MRKKQKRTVVRTMETRAKKHTENRHPKQQSLRVIHVEEDEPRVPARQQPVDTRSNIEIARAMGPAPMDTMEEPEEILEGLIRANSNIVAEVVTITPEMAEILLGRNEGNRPLSKRVISTYERDIAAGRWDVTGEPIILDEQGQVLDGQHRLNACLLAKQPFTTMLVRGVRRGSAFLSMGTGERRRAAHALAIAGEQNTKVLQAALKLLWTWERGELGRSKYYPSNAELQETLDHHPGIRPFVSTTFAKSVKGAPGSVVSALRYLFGQSNEDKAEKFFEQLSKGTGLTEESPVRLLRERLINSASSRDKIPQYEMCALFVKAWNAYITGERILVLKFRSAGKAAEDMPGIVGLSVAPEKAMTAV